MEKRDSGIAVQNPRHTYFDKVLMRTKLNKMFKFFISSCRCVC